MRMSENEVKQIKESVKKRDQNAKIYLFGSRTDDKKSGGDIDVLIITEKLTRKDIREIRIDFYDKFGEQKLDIVIDSSKRENPFVKKIISGAVEL